MAKRPRSITVTRAILWIYGIGTLLFQVAFTLPRVGVIDEFPIGTGVLALFAAIRLTKPVRDRNTFVIVLVALVLIAMRGFLTVRTQFLLRAEFPGINVEIIVTLIVSLAFIALALLFFRASRWFGVKPPIEGEQ